MAAEPPALGVLGEELQAAMPSARTATAATLPVSLLFITSKLQRCPAGCVPACREMTVSGSVRVVAASAGRVQGRAPVMLMA
jgi:hypothetical protein